MKKNDPKNNSTILLDQFSDADLRKWRTISGDEEKYHLQLFFHLEALRRQHHQKLCDALLNSSYIQNYCEKDWCRILTYKYSHEPLSAKGSVFAGGRFNIGKNLTHFQAFPALYIAESYGTAYLERFGTSENVDKNNDFSGHEFALIKNESFSSVNLNFNLQQVFDLTKFSNLQPFTKILSTFNMPKELKKLAKKLKIGPHLLVRNPQQLQKSFLDTNWRYYPEQHGIPSNSQIFGRFLRDAGFEGVLFNSTKTQNTKCIAVFTENLHGGNSYIELTDSPPANVLHTKMDSDNWRELSEICS